MHPSLDPEVFLAKLLCKFDGVEPEMLIPGGYDHSGTYFPHFTGGHLFDHMMASKPEVFAWRKYVLYSRKMIDEMTRNGQSIVQALPHYFHGDREPLRNYWISWWSNKSDFELYSPWQRTGYYFRGKTYRAGIQARSEKEAIAKIFEAYEIAPEFIRIMFIEEKPRSWSPFSNGIARAEWMIWEALPDDETSR